MSEQLGGLYIIHNNIGLVCLKFILIQRVSICGP